MTCCVLVWFFGLVELACFPCRWLQVLCRFIQHHKSSVLSSVCKWSPFQSLYDVAYTRSISVIVYYISSRSSLHCLHLVYISLCIWVPDCTSIFYQWTCKSEICLFFYTDRWDFQVSTQKAKGLFALLVIEFMCWSHCNLFVNARPKYLVDVTDSSVCPWSWYLASIVFFLLVTLSTVHLSGLTFMHPNNEYGLIIFCC